jgi:hypothetical protein
MSENINIEKIMDDPICKKWIAYSTTEDDKNPAEWFQEKQSYWEENEAHLKKNGFQYSTNIGSALDQVEIMKEEDLEGCLLVVKIGNQDRPASPDDINLAYKMLNEVLDGVKGVRVVVTHHAFDITKISLPQLRALQSSILSSTEIGEDINPIINLDL